MKPSLLTCKCGDCTHWEIGKNHRGAFIKCLTCGDAHVATVRVDPHDKLEYVPQSPPVQRPLKARARTRNRARAS